MAWKQVGESETMKATKELVIEFKNMQACRHERPKSEWRMKVYREILRKKQFRPCIWAKAFCRKTEKWYRINGQHTSNLLHEYIDQGKEIPLFWVIHEEYVCDKLKDVSRLYSTFDSADAARKMSDINRAFAGFVDELSGIPGRIIDNCVSGINFHNHRDGMWAVRPEDRAEKILHNVDFVLWVRQILGKKTDGDTDKEILKAMQRLAVTAFMYSTWLATDLDDDGRAKEFWDEVRSKETGKTTPTRALAEWLCKFKVSQTRDSRKGGSDYVRMYLVCLTAWNAWVRGEKVRSLKTPEHVRGEDFPELEMP